MNEAACSDPESGRASTVIGDERLEVRRVPLPRARLLPGSVPGPAGDGAAAVPVRAAAAPVAGIPRRLPGCAVLLLPPRRVLLRPLHHIRLMRPIEASSRLHVRGSL